MNPDVFIDTLVERLSARDLDGDMSLGFTDSGVLAMASPRGTVHVGEWEEFEGGIAWSLWRDGEIISTDHVPGMSDYALDTACREIGKLLGI